jgi:raffinose/stachyose/melibiose transport system permease protein
MQKTQDAPPIHVPNLTHFQKLRYWLQKDYWQYLVLILPAMILYLAFSIFPVFSSIGVATTDMVTVGTSYKYVGLANFTDILFSGGANSQKFYKAFFWTAAYWLGNWAMIFLLGFGPALILYERIKFKNAFLIIVFLPYVVSNLAMGFLLRMILDPSVGPLNWILQSLHITNEPIVFLAEGWPASLMLVLVTGWKFAGFNAAIFLAGLVAIPVETIESAKVDGANYFQMLFRVVIPQMWPTILAASVLCFTGTWRLFDMPVALAGSTVGGIKSLDVLAVIFYRWAFSTVGFGYASAMMLIVSVVLLAGSAIQIGLIRRTTVEY